MGRDVEMTDYDAALQTLSIERSSIQRRLVGLNRWLVRGFQGFKVGRSCSSSTAPCFCSSHSDSKCISS